MAYDKEFFDNVSPLPRKPKLGEPPPHFNGEDSSEELERRAAEEEAKGEPNYGPNGANGAHNANDTFEASPIDWDAAVAVPPREWVYGHFLIKRFVSVLGAPGGTGKTAYAFTIALCILTGRPLLNEPVHETGNVWIYNLEDPKDELLRRFRAAAQHWNISRSDVEGKLFLDSGRDRPLVIASVERNGTVIISPIVDQMIVEIQRRNIRLMIVDPFVRSHRLEENVNEQIDTAVALWGQVADKANCCILLVHHFRKGGVSGDAAAFRGASALIDAARSAISLAPMSGSEAEGFLIEAGDRWQYIRVDNAKLNLAPPPSSTLWLKLVSEDLGNGSDSRLSDRVQAVERWDPPTAWDGMPWSTVMRILDKIDVGLGDGEFYASGPQAKERWAGVVLAYEADKVPEQAKTILKAWLESGVLQEGKYPSPKFRRATPCVTVNPAKVEEMRQASTARGYTDDE